VLKLARSSRLFLCLGLLSCTSLVPGAAHADAIVRTQAMLATSILELFIEPGRVRAELEIGLADLDAFRLLLPDELYAKTGADPEPHAERLERFFREVLPVLDAAGEPLPGRLLRLEPRPRVRRDEITGEPLSAQEDPEEMVVFARLEYALAGCPAELTLSGPPGAGVGFVVYHEGVPVNDFRYLSPRQTLELDCDDPWYTSFRSRSLRRQYFAPMNGFLYVEPYEVRKEIIVRPRDLQRWVDLGIEGREIIPVELQAELKRRAAEFLREHMPVRIDERTIAPELERIHFLERSLRTSRVIEPPEPLEVHAAVLGVIFVYPIEGLPQRVTMDWDLWDARIQQVPVSAVDQAGPLPGFLEPDWRVLEWKNFLKHPELPRLRVLQAPPGRLAYWTWRLRWIVGAALLAGLLVSLRAAPSRRGVPLAARAALLVIGLGALWWSGSARISDERARELVSGLLHNVYRAFDFRDEEQIYDVLARSVEGKLLTQTYLETRRGLELAGQGGARARVKDIELVEISAQPAAGGGFRADAAWNVAGSVGHWGHVHQRANHYRARLHVRPTEAGWRLSELEILDERRL
jgi:hypothetical protein